MRNTGRCISLMSDSISFKWQAHKKNSHASVSLLYGLIIPEDATGEVLNRKAGVLSPPDHGFPFKRLGCPITHPFCIHIDLSSIVILL